jgi:hypothetical protein
VPEVNELITMQMLHDTFEGINTKQGNEVSLQYFHKLLEQHFKGNNYDAMDVKQSAQVLSDTMC